MVKVREFSESERAARNFLHLIGLSHAKTGKQIGCSKSAAFRVDEKFERKTIKHKA